MMQSNVEPGSLKEVKRRTIVVLDKYQEWGGMLLPKAVALKSTIFNEVLG